MNMLFSRLLFVFVTVVLVSCSSTTRDYRGVYEASEDVAELDVPPGLDKPVTTNEINLSDLGQSVKSYNVYEQNLKDKPKSAFDKQYKGMQFKRDGSLFWLEVNAPADEVWNDLRDYFTRLGFEIDAENVAFGYMQTSWLENRVDLPGGWIRDYFGWLYSADLMDRFRAHLEWDATQQITRVFIIHQGLREEVKGERNDSEVIQTKWVARPSEPGLEVEMIMRFMAYRGLEETIAESQINAVPAQEKAKLIEEGDNTKLIVKDTFQRAWRHMTIAIDRLGYLVEDKNRSAGVFYVQLPETFVVKREGFLGSLFSGETVRPEHDKYLIILEAQDGQTQVTVKSNGDVAKDFSKVSHKILQDIKANIL